MKKDIRERLRAEVLLADGAMGTLLVSRGAPAEGPRSPNALTAPELVREIHDDYVAAGAQLLSTNTWDANRSKLSRFDWADSLEKINREAVRLARAAAAGEYVYVAGAVGPLGQLVKPYGPLTRLHVRELFTEQIRILLEEGVDLLSFETFSSTLEAVEALRAARALSAGIPIVASMTFLADGKTSFGEDAEGALAALVAAGADVVGINCTVGPQEAFEIFSRVAGSVAVPVSVRPNAGYPWVVSGRTVYPATPDYFRQNARDLLRAGAALVGGCCGTAPEHVAAMAREVSGKARTAPVPAAHIVVVDGREARPRGAQRLDGFERRGERLEGQEIDALFQEDPDLLRKELAHVEACERSVRLHELSERPDGPRHVDIFPFGRGAGEAHGRAVDLLERVGPVEPGELRAVRVPRVRGEHLRAGRHVVVVDLAHEVGRGHRIRRARTLRRRAARYEQRPHRPVREEDFGLQPLSEVSLHEKRPLEDEGASGCLLYT